MCLVAYNSATHSYLSLSLSTHPRNSLKLTEIKQTEVALLFHCFRVRAYNQLVLRTVIIFCSNLLPVFYAIF